MSDDDSSCSSGDDEYPQMNADLSMPGSEKQMINVVVTGFGPFGEHRVNASWEAVKELQKLGVAHNVKLITLEIPVAYQSVKKLVPELWESYQPQLVVHVGVSSVADEITFETMAFNDGYKINDVTGHSAPSQCYVKNGAECLQTGLNIPQLCEDVNQSSCIAMAVSSSEAGRYLCEYTYYASLSKDVSRVAFIHVPPLDSPYSAAELGHALKCSIQSMLKQLHLYHPLPLPNPQLMDELLTGQLPDNDHRIEAAT